MKLRTTNGNLRRWISFALLLFGLGISDNSYSQENGELNLTKQLESYNIDTSTEGVILYLKGMLPNGPFQNQIQEQILKLGNEDYFTRQLALRKLQSICKNGIGRIQIEQALKSRDPDIAIRAKYLLDKIDNVPHQILVFNSIELLKLRKSPDSVSVLIDMISFSQDRSIQNVATEALWLSVVPKHLEQMEALLKNKQPELLAAGIVAYEVIEKQESIQKLKPFLKDDNHMIRIAACRALIDHLPKEVIPILVTLLESNEFDIAWQADDLLFKATSFEVKLGADISLAKSWKSWAETKLKTAKLKTPIGEKRLVLSFSRIFLEELFTKSIADATSGYGKFKYQATNGGKVSVDNGKLRLDGNHPEGDQRLYITSKQMLGREQWPEYLEVKVKLTGESENSGGYHIGVSVGNIKMIFHPSYPGGGFRFETTDNHDYLVQNTNMSFTPQPNQMYEMNLIVKRNEKETTYKVTYTEPSTGKKFNASYVAKNEQVGRFNRIGLERSGRQGGDALFDSISIKLGKR